MLSKITVEAVLNAELDDYLSYGKGTAFDAANYRNGTTSNTLQAEAGEFQLYTPRDRVGSFEL